LAITFFSYSAFLVDEAKALPKMLFFLIWLVAYRWLEFLLDVAECRLTQSADNWLEISFWRLAVFL
jgi:hypothetical protein